MMKLFNKELIKTYWEFFKKENKNDKRLDQFILYFEAEYINRPNRVIFYNSDMVPVDLPLSNNATEGINCVIKRCYTFFNVKRLNVFLSNLREMVKDFYLKGLQNKFDVEYNITNGIKSYYAKFMKHIQFTPTFENFLLIERDVKKTGKTYSITYKTCSKENFIHYSNIGILIDNCDEFKDIYNQYVCC